MRMADIMYMALGCITLKCSSAVEQESSRTLDFQGGISATISLHNRTLTGIAEGFAWSEKVRQRLSNEFLFFLHVDLAVRTVVAVVMKGRRIQGRINLRAEFFMQQPSIPNWKDRANQK
jgi:hypothetical protein